MKYRLGNIYMGKNNTLCINATSFRYSSGTYGNYGLIDSAGDAMGFYHNVWDNDWEIQDIYVQGYGSVTRNPMTLVMAHYAGQVGESRSTHGSTGEIIDIGAVSNQIIKRFSIMDYLTYLEAEDQLIVTFLYSSEVGQESGIYVNGMVIEYKIK